MPTSSRRLRDKIELVLPEYALPGRLLLDHPRARELYPRYLSVVYFLPRTGLELMQTALERAKARAADDPVAAGLVPYVERHIDEERHGDEPGAGVLADLELLGVDSSRLREQPPPTKVAALVGAQYFWILTAHPIALLGYLTVVEAFHPQESAIERLIERTGYPRGAFRQLSEHAELDVEHGAEIDRLLDTLPLAQAHERLLALSALGTVELLTAALLDVFDLGPASEA